MSATSASSAPRAGKFMSTLIDYLRSPAGLDTGRFTRRKLGIFYDAAQRFAPLKAKAQLPSALRPPVESPFIARSAEHFREIEAQYGGSNQVIRPTSELSFDDAEHAEQVASFTEALFAALRSAASQLDHSECELWPHRRRIRCGPSTTNSPEGRFTAPVHAVMYKRGTDLNGLEDQKQFAKAVHVACRFQPNEDFVQHEMSVLAAALIYAQHEGEVPDFEGLKSHLLISVCGTKLGLYLPQYSAAYDRHLLDPTATASNPNMTAADMLSMAPMPPVCLHRSSHSDILALFQIILATMLTQYAH